MVRAEVRTDKQILKTVNSALAPPATEGSACPDILFCKIKHPFRRWKVIRNGCWVYFIGKGTQC